MRGHRGYRGLTIYKSGSCDLGPGHTVRAHNQNKAGPWLGRGHARVGPWLGRAGAGLRLGRTSTVIPSPMITYL
jgi:hypothetical protein